MSRNWTPLFFSAIASLGAVEILVATLARSDATSKPKATSVTTTAVTGTATSTTTAEPAVTPEGDGAGQGAGHGSRRLRRGEAPVRVDGLEIAVLAAAELPPGLSMVRAPKHDVVRFYRVTDYLRALRVPVANVRAIHFIGNRDRIASIEGDELRAQPTRFVFDFTRTTEGTPSVRWDTTGLRNTKRIDAVLAVEVFVTEKPRAVDTSLGCYASAEGRCEEGVAQEAVHGTRVYLDGRIVAHVKRREIERESATAVPLGRMLKIVGVDTSAIGGFELVGDDGVAMRAAGRDAHDRLWQVTLSGARGAHGRPVANLPETAERVAEESSGSSRTTPVDAVLLHRTAATAQL